MSRINFLGDDLSVRLSRADNFSNETTSDTLIPPINRMNVFRVLSNHVVEIYCSFAYNSGILLEDGSINETKTIVAGLDDVWYRCVNHAIYKPIIYLVNPEPRSTVFDSVDLVFQFASEVPPEYAFVI